MQQGDEKLLRLVQNLEKSIEQAISSSPQVEECLTRVRDQGLYLPTGRPDELSLVLQATLAFAPLGELDQKQVEKVAGVFDESDSEFRMSTLDRKFLRSLKIAVDEEK